MKSTLHLNSHPAVTWQSFGSLVYYIGMIVILFYFRFNLYKSLGDHSSARGIYLQDISTVSSDVEQAMTYEILQQYENAQQSYKKSIEKQDIDSKVCITTIQDMLC